MAGVKKGSSVPGGGGVKDGGGRERSIPSGMAGNLIGAGTVTLTLAGIGTTAGVEGGGTPGGGTICGGREVEEIGYEAVKSKS